MEQMPIHSAKLAPSDFNNNIRAYIVKSSELELGTIILKFVRSERASSIVKTWRWCTFNIHPLSLFWERGTCPQKTYNYTYGLITNMIHVIATIRTAPGRREEVLRVFRALVPQVHAETGCIEYGTAVDLPNVVDGQPEARPDVITVVEKWEDPAALRAHLAAPHMVEFRTAVKELLAGVEIRVVSPA
jgi:quinol monooxygenase YgiN